MLKGLYTAYTGMINEQNRVDTLSNNLANAATTGFKAEGTTSEAFKDVLAYKIKDTSEPGIARRLGTMNMGVKIGENYVDYSQGPFHETGNDFDLALSGKGFFAVDFMDKEGNCILKYTRDGAFTLNVDGALVNKNGDFLMSTNNTHIILDPTQNFRVDRQGVIYQNDVAMAQIQVVDFEDYDYLERYGENYFQPVDGATQIASTAQVYGGYLEASNVQVVKEMVDLISFTRAYESNQKIVQAYDETLGKAVNDVGKV